MSAAVQSSVGWQTGFLAILPAVARDARIQFRRLPAEQREDAIQEAIASACVSFQRLAAQGRLHTALPTPLANFAVKSVRSGRHVGGHQDAAKDVMSPACQGRHGVRVRSYHAPRSGDGSDGWRQVAIAERKTSIPDTAAFRIDFPRWLWTLTGRDRKIINAMMSGEGTFALANRFGISPGRVSQLRRTYQRLWRSFHGEPACDAA